MASVAASGIFKIGGEIAVHRLGYGAMRITGRGIWGDPEDRSEAIATLKRLPDLGINFIDTADSYGPDVSEELVREALHPYGDILVATKAGLARTGPSQWVPLGRPEYLIQQAHTSRRRLGVETIGLWQLHRIDSKVPRDEQFGAIKSLISAGVIRHAGLSEVSIAEIEAAQKVFKVATVQNRYNFADRSSEDVLDYCEIARHRLHPVVPARRRRSREAGLGARRDRARARGDARADRSRVAAPAQSGHAADPRHVEGRAPRGEHRGGRHKADRRRIHVAGSCGARRRAVTRRRFITGVIPAKSGDPAVGTRRKSRPLDCPR